MECAVQLVSTVVPTISAATACAMAYAAPVTNPAPTASAVPMGQPVAVSPLVVPPVKPAAPAIAVQGTATGVAQPTNAATKGRRASMVLAARYNTFAQAHVVPLGSSANPTSASM